MKKETLLNILNYQRETTTKTTRKDIISLVSTLAQRHLKDNSEIVGVSPTRNLNGVNLGDIVEILVKSLFRNKLEKSNKKYDAQIKGEKVEIKFTTSDAYAHPINKNAVVDYYLIVAYSKALGGQIFKVPYNERNNIQVNNQERVVINQKAKYIDKELTKKVFGE